MPIILPVLFKLKEQFQDILGSDVMNICYFLNFIEEMINLWFVKTIGELINN